MPPLGGAAGGGLSEQEQATVKMVCVLSFIPLRKLSLTRGPDASGHGVVSDEIDHGGWNGFRGRRCFWSLHVECTSAPLPFFFRIVCKTWLADHVTALLDKPFLFPWSRFMGRGSANVVDHLHRCRTIRPSLPKDRHCPTSRCGNSSAGASKTWAHDPTHPPKTSVSSG
jgi:hypothetical protein